MPVLLPAADAATSLCGGTEPIAAASTSAVAAAPAPSPSSKRAWRGGSLSSLVAAVGTTPDGAGAAARAAHVADAVRLLLRHGRICEALSLCTALLPPVPDAERARLDAAAQAQAQYIASFAPTDAAALARRAKQAEGESLAAAWSSPAAQSLPWLPFTIIELAMRVCASAMEAGHPAALPLSPPTGAGAGSGSNGSGMAADGEADAADAADASPLGRLREELLSRLQFHIAERVPRAEVFARSHQAARAAQEQAAAAAAGVARIEAQRAAETAAALAAAAALPKAASAAGAGAGAGSAAREALDEDDDGDDDFAAVPSFGRRFG